MSDTSVFDQPLVFGLDIGTRNVVGTVGYKTENEFVVVAQYMLEHETRAMLDGQIEDIDQVAGAVSLVTHRLEEASGRRLTRACVAAAGRALRTELGRSTLELSAPEIVIGNPPLLPYLPIW